MGKSSETPAQPSAQEQAAAQLALNQGTALFNAQIGSPNVINPFGSSTWTMGGQMGQTAGSMPTGYNLPAFNSDGSSAYRFPTTGAGMTGGFNSAQLKQMFDISRGGSPAVSVTDSAFAAGLRTNPQLAEGFYSGLTPEQKAGILALGSQVGGGSAGGASGALSGIGAIGGGGFGGTSGSGAPQFTNTQTWNPEGMALFNQVFGNTTMPDNATLASQAKSLEDATYEAGVSKMAPQMQAQEAAFANAMATRGIPVGSELYNQQRALLDKSRQESLQQLALASMQAGREEQNRLFNLDLAGRNYQSGLLGMYSQNVPNSSFGATASSAPDIAGYMQNQYTNQLNAANSANQRNASTLGVLGNLGGIGLASYLSPTAAAATPTLASAVASGTPLTASMFGGGAAAGGLGAALSTAFPWLAGAGILASILSD